MSNTILSVAGSRHQGHERFSEISRGRQRSFMSFSALLFTQLFASMGDFVSKEIGSMYLDALERQSIPDTEILSLTYLPDRARWTVVLKVQSPVEAIEQHQSH